MLLGERQLGRRPGSQLVTLPDRPSASTTNLTAPSLGMVSLAASFGGIERELANNRSATRLKDI